MSNLATQKANPVSIERVLVSGDLSALSESQRMDYYANVCGSLGLNPLTKPFDYIKLNNKLTLYAKRDATDQLRKVHGVSITISARDHIGDVYIVTAKAKDKTGREDESTGAVSIAGLKGEALANAFMKAETKAKRRVTLSICGLGMLDETEVGDIPPSQKQEIVPEKQERIVSEPPQQESRGTLARAVDKEDLDPANYEIKVGFLRGKKIFEATDYELRKTLTFYNAKKNKFPDEKELIYFIDKYLNGEELEQDSAFDHVKGNHK